MDRLFDHFVGTREKRLRYSQAKRRGGSEIDDQLEVGRLLNGDVCGLCSAQQLDQLSGPNVPVDPVETRPIGDEAALLGRGGK
jgi:hypothetical protein